MVRILLKLSLLVLLNTGCLAETGLTVEMPGSTTETVGHPTLTPELAHDFTLETLNGKTVTLSDLRGQWVLINFWATWCRPCVEEMPALQKLAQERGLVVLGVNFNEPGEAVAEFIAQHHISFPILMNPDDITLLTYQVRALPRTFVIAPDGTMALSIAGTIDSRQFDAWLDTHLIETAEKANTVAEHD